MSLSLPPEDPPQAGPERIPEQVPEPSEAVAALFGDRVGLARAYVARLCDSGVGHGLIGPREVPRIWERHVGNCAVVAELVPEGARLVDVGSGAGLPGLAIAIARPDVAVTLVEPMLRRTTWLEDVVAELGLETVRVVRARAEEVAGQISGQVVTSRAVARLEVLASWCLPLAEPGGALLALKGASAAEELAAARAALVREGATGAEVLTCGEDALEQPTTVVRVCAGKVVRRRGGRNRRAKRG